MKFLKNVVKLYKRWIMIDLKRVNLWSYLKLVGLIVFLLFIYSPLYNANALYLWLSALVIWLTIIVADEKEEKRIKK